MTHYLFRVPRGGMIDVAWFEGKALVKTKVMPESYIMEFINSVLKSHPSVEYRNLSDGAHYCITAPKKEGSIYTVDVAEFTKKGIARRTSVRLHQASMFILGIFGEYSPSWMKMLTETTNAERRLRNQNATP